MQNCKIMINKNKITKYVDENTTVTETVRLRDLNFAAIRDTKESEKYTKKKYTTQNLIIIISIIIMINNTR